MNRHLPWEQRFENESHLSERVFEAIYGDTVTRIGLDRADIDVRAWPPFLRHQPDYASAKAMFEVMGTAGVELRLKVAKLQALMEWQAHMPVYLFVLDSTSWTYSTQPIHFIHRVASVVEVEHFTDGNPYHAIPARLLGPWSDAPELAPSIADFRGEMPA